MISNLELFLGLALFTVIISVMWLILKKYM
jgi:hypothetical protein